MAVVMVVIWDTDCCGLFDMKTVIIVCLCIIAYSQWEGWTVVMCCISVTLYYVALLQYGLFLVI